MMVEPGYEIQVNAEELSEHQEERLRQAAWHALDVAGAIAPSAMSVTVTTAEHIRQLNRDYAGLDEVTDVLAFGAEEEPYAVEPGEAPYLGDVIIARSVAEQQAEERGHPLLTELQILAIHGTLHLLGYDHQDSEQQAEMWAAESTALDALRAAD